MTLPAAPAVVAPELALLVIGLSALCVVAVLKGVRFTWNATFGALFVGLAGLLNFDHWVVHIHWGGPILRLNTDVQNAITRQIDRFDGYAGYFFHEMAVLVEWAFRELEHFGAETYFWAQWLQRVHLGRFVKAVVATAFPAVLLARMIRAAIAAELPKLERVTRVTVHDAVKVVNRYGPIPYAADWHWLHRHWKALTHVVLAAGAIAIPIPHVGADVGKVWRGLTKRVARIERRLGRLEALLGVAGMAAAMANVVGVPNWRCLTKGPVGKVSRALCGLGTTALEDLLGLLVDLLVLENICEVITLLEDGLSLVAEPVTTWLDSATAQFVHCHYDLPAPLPPVALHTPPVSGIASIAV